MATALSKLVHRSRAARLSALAAALLALAPRAAAAQNANAPPRVGALVGAGIASTPDLGPLAVTPETLSAMLATLGVRLRPARHVFVDVASQIQITTGRREDRTLPGPPPVSRWWAEQVRDRELLASSEVRVGAETTPAGAPAATAHAAFGGGYLWGVAQPFVSLTGGVATGVGASPGGLRLTADLEYRRFRLPALDRLYDARTGVYEDVVTGSRPYEGRRILLVRVGVEVPLVSPGSRDRPGR